MFKKYFYLLFRYFEMPLFYPGFIAQALFVYSDVWIRYGHVVPIISVWTSLSWSLSFRFENSQWAQSDSLYVQQVWLLS